MDRYVYLVLSAVFFVVWGIFYILRKDLRKTLLIAGVAGLITGPIAELWYFQDYWHPLAVVGTMPFVEDALFGFSVSGISVAIYNVIFNQKNNQEIQVRRKNFIYTSIILSVLFLIVFATILKINSIFVSAFTFVLFTVYILIQRPILMKRSLVSGFALMIVAFLIYCPLFTFWVPDYWQKYWLLAKTPYGITFLRIPLTELLWYFTWGCFAGAGYTYVTEKGVLFISLQKDS
jgi:hypothetical protein